jgi:hypothetical protein
MAAARELVLKELTNAGSSDPLLVAAGETILAASA